MSARSIVLDSEDNIYVDESYSKSVIKYSPSGDPLFAVGKVDNPTTTQTYTGKLAIDEDDNLYIANSSKKHIDKFDSQGRFIKTLGSGTDVGGEIEYIIEIGVDGAGNLYVLDAKSVFSTTQSVHKYSSTGEYLQKFDVKQAGPSWNPNDITSMAVRKDGGFYTVYDYHRQILQFDANGVLVKKFAGHGGGVDGNLHGTAVRLAVDREGNVYACDDHWSERTVNKYTHDGRYIRKYGQEYRFEPPIYDRKNNIYAISGNISAYDIEIHKYNPSTELELRFAPVFEKEYFSSPSSMLLAVDQDENIYYLKQNSDKQQIDKYNRTGQLVNTLQVSLVHENTTYGSVKGMFVDSKGIIHLVKKTTDKGGIYLSRLNQQGDMVGQPIRLGKGKIHFYSLGYIVFDDLGFVYTQDSRGHRIRKFSPYGDLLLAYGDTSLNKEHNGGNFSVDNHGNAYWSVQHNYSSERAIDIHKHNGEPSERLVVTNGKVGVNKSGTVIAALLFDGTIALYKRKQAVPQSYITGKIFTPTNNLCEPESSTGLAGIVVKAEPGPYYGISDESGSYTLAVEPGDYRVSQMLGNQVGIDVRELCSTTIDVAATQAGNFAKGPDFWNKVTLSPYLSVSVSSTRRRRCFESTTTVRYENAGFATAPDA
ncbi:hypothetical protein SAMN05421545_3934, partial [Pontibacter lucknowensis]